MAIVGRLRRAPSDQGIGGHARDRTAARAPSVSSAAMVLVTLSVLVSRSGYRILGACLKIIRALGGFPYSWKDVERPSRSFEKALGKIKPRAGILNGLPYFFEKKLSLAVYSWLFTALMAVHTVAYTVLKVLQSKDLATTTADVAQTIGMVVVAVSSFGLLSNLAFNNPSLFVLASRLHAIVSHAREHPWKPHRDVLFMITLLVCEATFAVDCYECTHHIVNLILYTEVTFMVMYLSLGFFLLLVMLNAVMAGTMFLYYALSRFMASGYEHILHAPKARLPRTRSGRVEEPQVAPVFLPSPAGEAEASFVRLLAAKGKGEVSVTPVSHEDLRLAEDIVEDLHEYQRRFNKYFSLAALLVQLQSVITVTVSIFVVFTTGGSMGVYARILHQTCFLVLLCCGPDGVNFRVGEGGCA